MNKNSKSNPRKSSNRGRQNKKNNSINFIDPIYEFDQERENEIFSSLLGLDAYCNMGIPSGFYGYPDTDNIIKDEISIKNTSLDDIIKNNYDDYEDKSLPF